MLKRSPTKGSAAPRALWTILSLCGLLAAVMPAASQALTPHIIFQNQSSGQMVDWLMNGTSLSSYGSLQDPGSTLWKPVGSGDFLGDGSPDILLQNQNTGELIYWDMNNTQFVQFGYINPSSPGSTNWKVVAVGDLNGDGRPDILFQSQTTGKLVYWIMAGTTLSRIGYLADPGTPNWKVVGTTDLNADHSTDLIFQNQQTGELAYWLMNHTDLVQYGSLANPGTINWQVVGVGYFTGGSTADILFQNQSNGQLVYWQMNGTSFVRFGYLTPSDPGSTAWRVSLIWYPRANGPTYQ